MQAWSELNTQFMVNTGIDVSIHVCGGVMCVHVWAWLVEVSIWVFETRSLTCLELII